MINEILKQIINLYEMRFIHNLKLKYSNESTLNNSDGQLKGRQSSRREPRAQESSSINKTAP